MKGVSPLCEMCIGAKPRVLHGKMRARVKGRAVALLPEPGRLEPSESRSFSGEAEDVQPVCRSACSLRLA